jgi:DNA replication protein
MTKKELFENFEKNWGRLLSPFEIEDISKWIDEDKFAPEIVNEALKQTVESNICSIRYLNKILARYERENIRTVEAVKQDKERFENRKAGKLADNSTTNIPTWSKEHPDYKPRKKKILTREEFLALDEQDKV